MSSSVECSSNSDSGPNSPPAGPHVFHGISMSDP
jgi:hypothetical protein